MADEKPSTNELVELVERLYRGADNMTNVAWQHTAKDMREAARIVGELAYLRASIKAIADQCGDDDIGKQLMAILNPDS